MSAWKEAKDPARPWSDQVQFSWTWMKDSADSHHRAHFGLDKNETGNINLINVFVAVSE